MRIDASQDEALALTAEIMSWRGLSDYVPYLKGASIGQGGLVFNKKIGPVNARVTADVNAMDGGAEVAIKQMSVAGLPVGWALRHKATETILMDVRPFSQIVKCSLDAAANLIFNVVGISIRALAIGNSRIVADVRF